MSHNAYLQALAAAARLKWPPYDKHFQVCTSKGVYTLWWASEEEFPLYFTSFCSLLLAQRKILPKNRWNLRIIWASYFKLIFIVPCE
jgi:hypothetical protein